jgi:hypothetical protein
MKLTQIKQTTHLKVTRHFCHSKTSNNLTLCRLLHTNSTNPFKVIHMLTRTLFHHSISKLLEVNLPLAKRIRPNKLSFNQLAKVKMTIKML